VDGTSFDGIAKKLASHRLTRRAAIGGGGAVGLSAALSAMPPTVRAQDDATPEAVERDSAAEVMFVQGYQRGSLAPASAGSGSLTLTLEDGLGQTVWFADRPSRKFGSVETGQFVEGFNFSDENPPNAALVTEVEGSEEILIVELMTPAYDQESRSITYEAKVLGRFDESESGQLTDPDAIEQDARELGASHLFIDSCSDDMVQCCADVICDDQTNRCTCNDLVGPVGPAGYCWSWPRLACLPCDGAHWTDQCNLVYGQCQDGAMGSCVSWPQAGY
jgi:hypothetical protein